MGIMGPPEIDDEAKPAAPDGGTRIGNVAHRLLIENQTINMDGRLEWIQTMEPEELQAAEKRLRRAAVRHEARAILPVSFPIGATLLVPFLAKFISDWNGWAFGARDFYVWTALAAIVIALPVWVNFYDTRRRNRRIVDVAERRLAEVIIELALREEDPERGVTPALRFWQWLKRAFAGHRG